MDTKILLGIIALILAIGSVNALSCDTCDTPINGYSLVGCSINGEHEGKTVPIGVGDGYIYLTSEEGKISTCEYWKSDLPLPPLPNQLSMANIISQIMKNYNNQMNNLPSLAKTFMGDENIIMSISKDNLTMKVAASTKNGKIIEIGNWIDENNNGRYDLWEKKNKTATMKVYMNIDSLQKISNSDNKVKAFKEAWGKDIKFEGITLLSKIKVTLMSIGISIAAIIS